MYLKLQQFFSLTGGEVCVIELLKALVLQTH